MIGSPELHRVVEFLNTLHVPDQDDVLADKRAAAWLAAWLARDGGTTRGVEALVAGDLTDLRDLREGIRGLAAARDGAAPDPAVVARAAAVLRSVPMLVDLGDDGRPARLAAVGHPDAVGRAIAAVAAAYLTVRSGDEWSRLKVCASAECRWAFLDTSRNRSRRWCEMSGCGNRAKNRAWRERQHPA